MRRVNIWTHHDRRAAGATLPHRIGAGHMSGQQPVCSVAGIELKGNVVRIHAGFTLSHEDAQRIVADNSVQLFRAVLCEVFGNVHGIQALEDGRCAA